MEDQSRWTCGANDVVHISMVQPSEENDKPKTLSTFHPEFTYPLFGEEETIFGYKNLSIRLRFAAHDLRSHLHISYDEKFKTVDDVEAVDLTETFREFLPDESFAPEEEFNTALKDAKFGKKFKPPGKLVHIYNRKKKNFEIWAGSMADPNVRALVDRMQIFTSFFIDGGTYIETDDYDWTLERWTVYLVYEKKSKPPTPSGSPYSFVGYSTTYRVYCQPNPEKGEKPKVSNGPFPFPETVTMPQLPARLRIAQFVIIPPYQHAGHGTELYRTIHRACTNDSTIRELTVEDPNEAFDALRDNNDYHILEPEFTEHNITINANPYAPNSPPRKRHVPTSLLLPVSTLDELRAKYKIAPTQYAHIVEMYLLSKIPASHRGAQANLTRLMMQKHRADNEHDRRYYWWRMLVKQRLLKKHRDAMVQMDADERIEKLDETVRNVEEGYEVLLKAFEEKAEGKKERKKSKEGKKKQKNKEKGKDKEKEKEKEVEDEEGEGEAENGLAGKDKDKDKERLKRKYIVIDDSDDEEEKAPKLVKTPRSEKRARTRVGGGVVE